MRPLYTARGERYAL